ncbi:MAG: arginine--tRNA ligase [bacterium]|nr:arginine--tRNA ligase [bacterium]
MIRDQLKKDLEKLVGQEVILEHPGDPNHGDFSTNAAMRLPGNPLENAKKILAKWEKPNYIERVEVVKPGFINFWLSKTTFGKELELALKDGERYGSSKIGSGKTLVLDHSHPNIAKRFGIGHLRSTIIGQALVKTYRFLGWNVVAENFLGDWGTQFGMIIFQIKRKGLNASDLSIDDLEKIYVEFNKEAEENKSLREEAKAWFKKLEDGDSEARGIWEAVKKTSMEEFERIWELLQAKFDYIHPESFFEDKVKEVINEAKEKGIAKEDEGALVIRLDGFENPLLLVKSDGATTYEARDLAAIKFWTEEFKPDIIAYEVGVEQSLHFQQVFAAADAFQWGNLPHFVHIKHGLYRSASGKKFSTRKGDTVRLEEVLEEAISRAGKLTKDGSDEVAKAVGIGAVKYFDLMHHHSTDIVFDWEKMFLLEGNSAPYLQYTFARTQSVLRKATSDSLTRDSENELTSLRDYELQEEEEEDILRTFYKFPEVVEEAAENYAPNLLCNFLFELAQKYNAFYNQHRILGNQLASESGKQDFRLALTAVTGNILKSGLNLLGIEAPSKM